MKVFDFDAVCKELGLPAWPRSAQGVNEWMETYYRAVDNGLIVPEWLRTWVATTSHFPAEMHVPPPHSDGRRLVLNAAPNACQIVTRVLTPGERIRISPLGWTLMEGRYCGCMPHTLYLHTEARGIVPIPMDRVTVLEAVEWT